MKTYLNIAPASLAAALLASTFITPSVDATRLGLTYHDSDATNTDTERATMTADELIGRKLNVETDVNASSFQGEDMPGTETGRKLSKKKKKKKDTCYIGAQFLIELGEDPETKCCAMPPLYYALLNPSLSPDQVSLIGAKCSTVRPSRYETGFQISLWQLYSQFSNDGVTDYPVCDGAVISPGLFLPEGVPDFQKIVPGFIDSPVIVSIPGLNLHCEGNDNGGCTFNGGEYQILSLPYLDFQGGIPVSDTSGLNIEGFTFTGEMKSQGSDSKFTYSIFLAAAGDSISIKNNVFVDISTPVSGETCNEGYEAIRAGPSEIMPFVVNIGILDIQVTIEDNVFENIDVGSYPVYAPEGSKKCSFCYYETKETFAQTRLIGNLGQEVNLKSNKFKDNTAQAVYFANPATKFFVELYGDSDSPLYNPDSAAVLAKYGCDDQPCFAGAIDDNFFKKNDIRYLVFLWDPNETSTVTRSGNEGECDQTYTGDAYCPLYYVAAPYELNKERLGNDGEPLQNCPEVGSQFCFSQKRVTNVEPRSGGCFSLNDP